MLGSAYSVLSSTTIRMTTYFQRGNSSIGTFPGRHAVRPARPGARRVCRIRARRAPRRQRSGDRKSVVSGKSVSVRVDLGGRRIIKKKTDNGTEKEQQKTTKK